MPQWLPPVLVFLTSVITAGFAYLKSRADRQRWEREHKLALKKHAREYELNLYEKYKEQTEQLWIRTAELESRFQKKEEELTDRIDRLYKRIGSLRDYSNALRKQVVEASLIPVPWPEDFHD